jgi:Zn-dependent protease
MVRFHLGKIPVEIHGSHLFITGLLAWLFASQPFSKHWPDSVLRNQSHPDFASTMALSVLAWMVIITLSVLVHELGHALVSRAFGYQSTIHLVGMGGTTRIVSEERVPWHKDVAQVIAGPGFGLLLGLACYLGFKAVDATGPDGARYVLRGAAWVNIFWSLMNLVPVPPLDGGSISKAVLQRVFGRKGFLYAQVIALVVAAAVLLLSLMWQQVFLAVFFGMYLVGAWSMIQAYRRGEVPAEAPESPKEVALGRAEALFREGKYDRARGLCEQLLSQEGLQASQQARAHHVLGWVELKEGRGREALNHFGRVQSMSVAPEALAAAFSLVGDEDRAVPLWHMAATASNSPTLRHELAGALIRAGRVSDARHLQDVRMSLAWTAAERVWALRGELEKAAGAAEEAFQAEPSAGLAYDAACAWARAGQQPAAMRMLQLASQNGFKDVNDALSDPDLSSLYETPDFKAWVSGLRGSSTA